MTVVNERSLFGKISGNFISEYLPVTTVSSIDSNFYYTKLTETPGIFPEVSADIIVSTSSDRTLTSAHLTQKTGGSVGPGTGEYRVENQRVYFPKISAGLNYWFYYYGTGNTVKAEDINSKIDKSYYSIQVKNNSASTILKGTAVKNVEYDVTNEVILVEAITSDSDKIIGILDSDVGAGLTGDALFRGNLLKILDTSLLSINDPIYVNNSGALVTSGTVEVGYVSSISVTGSVFIQIHEITPPGSVFSDNLFRVTDNIDVSKKVAFEVSGVTTATTRTLIIPDFDGPIAVINPGGPYRLITADAAGTGFTTHTGLVTDTLGGVGIGVSPTSLYKLNALSSEASGTQIKIENSGTGNTGFVFKNSTASFLTYVAANASYRIYGANASFILEHAAPGLSLFVEDTGRIGLGEGDPAARLHVKSPTSNSDDLAIFGSVDDDNLVIIDSAGGLYWSDGDTGVRESSYDSDVLIWKIGNIDRFIFDVNGMHSSVAGGFNIRNITSTATVPSINANRSDTSSGIGGVSGTVSLIAGSLEGLTLHNGAGSSTGTVLFVPNLTTAPSANPTGGGYLYSEAGALKWRGSSGTVTTIAVA